MRQEKFHIVCPPPTKRMRKNERIEPGMKVGRRFFLIFVHRVEYLVAEHKKSHKLTVYSVVALQFALEWEEDKNVCGIS